MKFNSINNKQKLRKEEGRWQKRKRKKENGNYKKVTDTFYKFHTASHP